MTALALILAATSASHVVVDKPVRALVEADAWTKFAAFAAVIAAVASAAVAAFTYRLARATHELAGESGSDAKTRGALPSRPFGPPAVRSPHSRGRAPFSGGRCCGMPTTRSSIASRRTAAARSFRLCVWVVFDAGRSAAPARFARLADEERAHWRLTRPAAHTLAYATGSE